MPENRNQSERPERVANPESADGRFAYQGLDRVIHEKARLGIMTSLVTQPDGLLFNDLKELCSLTDGNLSRHLTMLCEAGMIEVWKGHKHNRPQTKYTMTPEGRRRFLEYISVLESVVADALTSEERADATAKKLAGGWSPA